MNYFYLALLTIALFLPAQAQTVYGNEWVNPSQQYLRLGITETGLYRLRAVDFQQQGFDISTIPARSLQLFRRGQEVAIYVHGEEDGSLDLTDYIEFYGEKNDGYLDTLLYDSPRLMPHPHFSLYSDTATFFLTWAPDLSTTYPNGKRINPVASSPVSAVATYHHEQVLRVFANDYPAGNIYPLGAWYDDGYILTPYDEGEGWTGPTLNANQWGNATLQTTDPVRTRMQEATLELLFVGRFAGQHQAEIWVGPSENPKRKLGDIQWNNYGTALFKASLLPEDLEESGTIRIAYQNVSGSAVSVSYARWSYPQAIQLAQITGQKMLYPTTEAGLTFPSNESLLWFDVAVPSRPVQLLPTTRDTESTVAMTPSQSLLVVKESLPVSAMKPVRFRAIDSLRTNYLIITHPLVRTPVATSSDPVTDYAAYRASPAGGGYVPLVMNMDEVADQFNYGEPGPHGTRKLIKWLHDKGALRYTFLIGRSRSPQIVRYHPRARAEDMVPSMGWPDSDIALGMGLDPRHPDVPLVPIGRLNAANAKNVWDYLQKIKQHEASPVAAPWRKNILHLSGGRSARELTTYRNFLDGFGSTVASSPLAPALQTISKKTDEPVEQFGIAPAINQGVALMTLFGHSSLNITDIDIGFASDNARGYQNQGRYPAVLVNGCALGNFYFGPTPISTDWILAPNRGAILFLAHTHNGLEAGMFRYSNSLYEVIAEPEFASRPFGDIMQEGIRRYMAIHKGLSDRVTAQQMNLQGDPALVVFPATKPDYAWKPGTIRITNQNGGPVTTWNDSLRVEAEVVNFGRLQGGTYSLTITRKAGSQPGRSYSLTRKAVPLTDSIQIVLPNDNSQAGEETWEFVIDPDNEIPEENETNNSATQTIRVSEGGAIPLLPADGIVVNNPTVELVAQVPTNRIGQRILFELANNPAFTTPLSRDTLVAVGVLVRKIVQLADTSPQTIYWRVRMLGDTITPPRIFTYDRTAITPTLPRPEGVASVATTYPDQLDEGAVFTTTILFENISTAAFQDSVEVLVLETGERSSTVSRFKISSLPNRATYTFVYNRPTLGKAGQNRVRISFNANQLPEELYANNSVELRYEVLPDKTPPVLDVTINNRRIRDLEVVAPQPTLQIRLLDTNPYLLRSDTTGFRVRLLPECNGCTEIRVGLENARWSPNPASNFVFELPLPPLDPGTYTLTVEARDISGNAATSYQIRFRITENARIVSSTASPNPARYWVKFSLELEGATPPTNWTINVLDPGGKLIRTLHRKPHLGTNELYWFPIGITPGLYLYNTDLEGDEWKPLKPQSGRILISP